MKTKKHRKKSRENFFTKTLQRQILIPFITLILLAGAGIGYISYTYSTSLTTGELTNSIESQTNVLNQSFETFFKGQEQIIDHYAEQNEFTNFENERSAMMDSLANISSSNEAISTAYLGTETEGEMLTAPALDLPDDYDPRTRPWYQLATENAGEVIWTEPYLDAESGELIVSAAKSVANVGVLSIDINMQAILDMIDTVEIGDSGYAAILDQSGLFVVHPDSSYIGKDVAEEDFYKEIMAQNSSSGSVDFTLDGSGKTSGYTLNDRLNWIILGTVDKAELAKKSQPILIPIAISILVVLLLSALLTWMIAKRITSPIKTLQEKMKAVEEGDLSIDLSHESTNEVGQLSKSIDEMKESLRAIIKNVSEATTAVSGQSSQLTRSADEVKEGSQQIASTMQELTSGAETQANSSTELSEMMSSFMAKIQQAHEGGEQIADTSSDVLKMTKDGSSMMVSSVDQMKNIERIVKDAVSKVQGLDSQSQEISKLIKVINEIAEQTNLLSLNAAIEAARAGEHGKGFAVVANEVRKLAEQVSNSVVDITEIVGNIQNESSIVAKSLEAGYQEVDEGSKQIQATGDTFTNIDSSVSQMVEKIQHISENLRDIADNSNNMNESIQEIAAVSEESAAGIEQVSASAQQSTSSMEEVSNNAGELSRLAEELNDQIKIYLD
ncbi:methyl-accepting chemotaxis protein [Sediminibacillus albus]|uniref:Methyl-accepting chemotaxis protein n=1 Tax=Sediminibacillus albus TaxID=407036 RepID=A0A1G9A0R6_9BACI|nr:methyl-accepting chemotaxis protein [Sediminibacillus albus]SDK20464.1 methyl-accepting chemotaxis protein [Sediminibacillus albus]